MDFRFEPVRLPLSFARDNEESSECKFVLSIEPIFSRVSTGLFVFYTFQMISD